MREKLNKSEVSKDVFLLCPQGVRIFTLGIDQSVNEGFLKRLAALTPAGACELVESQGRLENAMDRIHRLICTPALSDVQIDGPKGEGIEPIDDTCAPSKATTVFTGVPTVVSGRYRKTSAEEGGARAHFVTLSGKTAAGESWSQAVQAQQTLNPALSALWARTRINELDDRFTIASARLGYYHGMSGVQTPNPDKRDDLRASILAPLAAVQGPLPLQRVCGRRSRGEGGIQRLSAAAGDAACRISSGLGERALRRRGRWCQLELRRSSMWRQRPPSLNDLGLLAAAPSAAARVRRAPRKECAMRSLRVNYDECINTSSPSKGPRAALLRLPPSA